MLREIYFIDPKEPLVMPKKAIVNTNHVICVVPTVVPARGKEGVLMILLINGQNLITTSPIEAFLDPAEDGESWKGT